MSISRTEQHLETRETPYIIALSGGSASGKSFLATRLAESLHPHAQGLSLDNFYRHAGHLSAAEQAQIDFDVPSAIDWATFLTTLKTLRSGAAAKAPRYHHSTHSRESSYQQLEPKRILIVEGLWLFHSAVYQTLYDQRIFIHCPEPTRLQRRVHRDGQERGRSQESVTQQFQDQVVPNESKWVLPQKEFADKIVESPIEPVRIDELAKQLYDEALGNDAGSQIQ